MDKKRQKVIKSLENHLRQTRRQLVKMDTEEEAVQFLIDSFIDELYCDFVGVILGEDTKFIPKAWRGNVEKIETVFPLEIEQCSSKLLTQSLRYDDKKLLGSCKLANRLEHAGVKTWFTVPLIDDEKKYGFCMIGFYTYIPLFNMYQTFDEFGKDVAVAISMARRKNKQHAEQIDWIQYFSIHKSLDDSIQEFTLRAASVTNAKSACLYLYNEKESYFVLQTPTYGKMNVRKRIYVTQKNTLHTYFTYFEQSGGKQITIPIVIDLEIIGVLHVVGKKDQLLFSEDDQHALRLLTDHIAILLENAQLYNKEKEQRSRLQFLLDYQQNLVKETVIHDDFHGIADKLGGLYQTSVIILNRFLRPITWNTLKGNQEIVNSLNQEVDYQQDESTMISFLKKKGFSVWPIQVIHHVLGYLVIEKNQTEMDELDQLMVSSAKNICSVQFIKQKLVIETNEHVKELFMDNLFVEKIEDKEKILQYANLFHWDMFQAHRVTTLSIELDPLEAKDLNLLEQEVKKDHIWDYILHRMLDQMEGVLRAKYQEHYVLFIPIYHQVESKNKWQDFYTNIKKVAHKTNIQCDIYLGIGSVVTDFNQYYVSYKQSVQALNIVKNRFQLKGYALFEELGSYTILHRLDNPTVQMFMESQLGVIHEYSKENNVDLWSTLRAYLDYNGNVKQTSEELFMHRSTLIYRIEKIENLLGVDLKDSDVRFNLMMAYKLCDMKEYD